MISRGLRDVGICLFGLLLASPSAGAPPVLSGQGLFIRVEHRSPTQISAFYEARGFPEPALKILADHCFLTVVIHNNSKQVVWLEPGRWRLQPEAGTATAMAPLTLEYWHRQWQQIGLSRPKMATFRWTQLPPGRDLQPQEPVGGNLTIPRLNGKFRLKMVFATGADRSGPEIERYIDGLRCTTG